MYRETKYSKQDAVWLKGETTDVAEHCCPNILLQANLKKMKKM